MTAPTNKATNEQMDELDRILASHHKKIVNSTGKYYAGDPIEILAREAKAALQAYIAHHTKEAERRAGIDESRVLNMRFTTVRGNTPKDKLKAEGYMLCRDEWDRVRYEREAELATLSLKVQKTGGGE